MPDIDYTFDGLTNYVDVNSVTDLVYLNGSTINTENNRVFNGGGGQPLVGPPTTFTARPYGATIVVTSLPVDSAADYKTVMVGLRIAAGGIGYFACLQPAGSGKVTPTIRKGQTTTVATGTDITFVDGMIVGIRELSRSTTSVTLEMLVNGTVVLTYTDSSSVLAETGQVGFGWYGGPGVLYVDRFVAGELKKAVFGIDSWSYGVNASTGGGTVEGTTFPAVCLANLGAHWVGVNLGTPGQQLANTEAASGATIDAAYDSAMAENWFVLQGGINDNYALRTPLQIFNDFKALALARKTAHPTVKVAVMAMPRLVNHVNAGANYLANAAAVNKLLALYWPTFADAFDPIAEDPRIQDPNIAPPWHTDRLHLVDAGNAVLGTRMAKAIRGGSPKYPQPINVPAGTSYGPNGTDFVGVNYGDDMREDFPAGGGLQAYTVTGTAAVALAITPSRLVDHVNITVTAPPENTTNVGLRIVGYHTASSVAVNVMTIDPLPPGKTTSPVINLADRTTRFTKYEVQAWKINTSGTATINAQASC